MTLHDSEFKIDEGLVERLLHDQMPDLSGLLLERLETLGTVNVVFRLGPDLVVRLPRTADYSGGPVREANWMPVFASQVPIHIPEYHALGSPVHDYPSHWSILEWVEGTSADRAALTDLNRAAVDLGEFVAALGAVSTEGAPEGGSYRGFGLARVDRDFKRWVDQLPEDINRNDVVQVWESCLSVGEWTGPPTWFHSDLRGDNLIARNGELVAVIDWEGCTVGDPSADYLAAWWLFDGDSREAFRDASKADRSGWRRAMGWALLMSVAAIPYYAETNPSFVEQARLALDEVLTDHRESYS